MGEGSGPPEPPTLPSSSFLVAGEIGYGSFSEVYEATEASSGRRVALKRSWLERDGSDPASLRRELAALAKVRHECVIEALAVVREEYAVSLAIPRYATDLDEALRRRRRRGLGPVSEPVAKAVVMALARALDACERAGVAHRDVAAGNVLVSQEGRVVLSDFGASRCGTRGRGEAGRAGDPDEPGEGGSSPGEPGDPVPPAVRCKTPGVGTRWYKAPEALLGSRSYDGAPADAWSLGAVVAELLSGEPLVRTSTDLEAVLRIATLLGPPPPEGPAWPTRANDAPDLGRLRFDFAKGEAAGAGDGPGPPGALPRGLEAALPPAASPLARSLVAGLLRWVPGERMVAGEVLGHPWLAEGPGGPAAAGEVAAALLAEPET